MKRIVLLFALLPTLLFGQTPFGYHATWIFEYDEAGFQGVDSLYHEKDTVYLGETWQYLKRGANGLGRMYVQTKNDTVYYLDNGQKLMLYDFSAGVGDSWEFAYNDTASGCPDSNLATVKAVGFDTVSGTALPYQIVEDVMDTIYLSSPRYQVSSAFSLGGMIYNRIGKFNFGSLYPVANPCNGIIIDYFFYTFRCYHDDDISVNFTAHDCKTGIGLNEVKQHLSVKIYPNPSNGFVFIDTESSIANVEVYNVSGQKLRSYQTEKTIELPQPAGLYFLHITFENGGVRVEKVVRE
jgi:hypothetical protein